MITKFLQYFTFINWILIGLLVFIKEPFYKDIVRGTTMFCFAGVLSVWISCDIREVYRELFDSVFPQIDSDAKMFIMFCGDMLLHVLPFLILGLPLTLLAIAIAYGILLIWYFWIKDRIYLVYPSCISNKLAMVLTSLFGALIFIRT
jgi:cell division protein FtsX